ncbi:MAG: hypothetical protein V1776_04235 [Candidatus Diapherotrites archaeon]
MARKWKSARLHDWKKKVENPLTRERTWAVLQRAVRKTAGKKVAEPFNRMVLRTGIRVVDPETYIAKRIDAQIKYFQTAQRMNGRLAARYALDKAGITDPELRKLAYRTVQRMTTGKKKKKIEKELATLSRKMDEQKWRIFFQQFTRVYTILNHRLNQKSQSWSTARYFRFPRGENN